MLAALAGAGTAGEIGRMDAGAGGRAGSGGSADAPPAVGPPVTVSAQSPRSIAFRDYKTICWIDAAGDLLSPPAAGSAADHPTGRNPVLGRQHEAGRDAAGR